MRKPVIAGNWKMYKTYDDTKDFCEDLKENLKDLQAVSVIVCPPFTSLSAARKVLSGSNIYIGAQNLYPQKEGAYTGEISPLMLKNAGCRYVIIGHSERRQYFQESNEFIKDKVKSAFAYSLIPILCVGETLKERAENKTKEIIESQVKAVINFLNAEEAKQLIVAYEPVWAIGTGKNSSPEDAEEVIAFIRNLIKQKFNNETSQRIRLLYGGSVKPEIIGEFIKKENIDGALVGGASLSVESFTKIINLTKKYYL